MEDNFSKGDSVGVCNDILENNESLIKNNADTIKKVFNAPKVVGLYLTHIQSYIEPTFIPFSQDKTVIRGPNDAGKSVIEKCFRLFAGVFEKDDYACLVNYNFLDGQIYMYLSNRTILAANITVEVLNKGKENQMRVGKVNFVLYNWQTTAILKQWDKYSFEIVNYLGWISIEGENLCVNLVDGKKNILINTSPEINTQLTEVVCRNPDLELRLKNIEDATIVAKETKKQVQLQIDVLSDKIGSSMFPTEKLSRLKDELTSKLFHMNILYHMEDIIQAKIKTTMLMNKSNLSKNLLAANILDRIIKNQACQYRMKSTLSVIKDNKNNIKDYEVSNLLKEALVSMVRINTVQEVLYNRNTLVENIKLTYILQRILYLAENKTECAKSAQNLCLKEARISNLSDKTNNINTNVIVTELLKIIILNIDKRERFEKSKGLYLAKRKTILSTNLSQIVISYIAESTCLSNYQQSKSNIDMVRDLTNTIFYSTLVEVHQNTESKLTSERSKIPVCPECNQVVEKNEYGSCESCIKPTGGEYSATAN